MTNDIISEYRVLKSAAGYYVGQGYREAEWEDGMYFLPWNRCSGYFESEEQARCALRILVLTEAWDDDDEYIMLRAYFDDPLSFWHLINNYS